MRIIRWVILGALAIALVTIALANRGPMTVRLLPEPLEGLFGLSWQVTMPVFIIIVISMALGVLLGFVWEWVREHKHRSEAASERRMRQDLEQQVKTTQKPQGERDEILALVENR